MKALARRATALGGLTACLLICAAALWVSGAAGTLHALLLAAAAAWQHARWSGRGGPADSRRRLWEIAAFGALLFFLADLFVLSRNLIGSALRLLLFIVGYHADTPQTPRGARQTLATTFIQMIAASASTTEVGFSPLMAGYLAAALWTLAALGAAEREDGSSPLSPRAPAAALRGPLLRQTGILVPIVAAAGIGIFFAVPHYGTGYFRESGAPIRRNLSGFSERIELGAIGTIKKSHATVLRVRSAGGGPPPAPLRLRGVALDAWDGRSWSVSDPRRRELRRNERGAWLVDPELASRAAAAASLTGRDGRREAAAWMELEILLEPLESAVLFTPADTATLSLARGWHVDADRQQSLFLGISPSRRLAYRTISRVRPPAGGAAGPEPPGGAGAWLALPPLDPRVERIARDVTRDVEGAEARARALEEYLLRTQAYSLDVDDAGVASPLVHFLVEGKPGHCEYFASALAVLLRVSGVPSRVVNGFLGGDPSDLTDQTILRQSDAHAWVEAWIPGRGWTTFDATPPAPDGGEAPGLAARLRRLAEETEIAWDTWIVGLDLEDQREMVEDFRDRVDLALAGAVISLRAALRALEGALGIGGRGLAAAVLASALAAAAGLLVWAGRLLSRALWGSRAAAPPHPATVLFARFERAAARRGLHRDPAVSPGAFARDAGAPGVGSAFEAARYGPEAIRSEALASLRERIAEEDARLSPRTAPRPPRRPPATTLRPG